MKNSKTVNIRPITVGDTDLVVKWRNNPKVRKNFIFQEEFTREIHSQWLSDKVFKGKVIQFIIIAPDNKPIGSVFLRDIDKTNNKAEFGIFIGEDKYRGNGLGTQASLLILKYAFEKLNLNKVFLRVLSNNVVALNSYEKVGFVKEGLFRNEISINNEYRDIVFMSILRSEWKGMKEKHG